MPETHAFLPYGRQCIDEDDIKAVVETLRSDFLTTGPKVQEFEENLCEATGAKYAVACSSGTTALHLAALAHGIQKDDFVIVPSLTFLASANAARYCGAHIIFSDVNPQTGLMETKHFEEALSKAEDKDVRAVFPVHLKGQSVDLKALSERAKHHNIKIIADACHTIGGKINDKPVGACEYEDASAFSFHPVKTIATGEGGVVTTNDESIANHMRTLRHHGMINQGAGGPWTYEMSELGYNYRITDIQCALGISQLKKLKTFVKKRQDLVRSYNKELSNYSAHIQTPIEQSYSNPAWHLYALQIDFKALGITRAELMNALKEEGIGTQVHYIPVHTQPYYKELYGEMFLPGAMEYYEKTLSFPLYPSMTAEDVVFVTNTLKQKLGVS